MRVRIVEVASALPERVITSAQVERNIMQHSPGVKVPHNIIEQITGIKTRRYVEDHVNTSDLAAEACLKVLARSKTPASEVDLLVFASAGQDLVEPATAHIVQHKIGTKAAVMDLKNACNSFLNGLQVAEALLLSGQYRRALVTVGETPSKCVRWGVPNRHELRLSFPGYTFGDAGAAVLLETTEEASGIFYRKFKSLSEHWHIGALPGGGSMHPRGDEYTYFRGDGTALKDIFVSLGPSFLREAMQSTGTRFEDFSRIFVHQATIPFMETFLKVTKVPRQKVVLTLPELGNMAAASLPVALSLAESRGEIKRGDKAMMIGLAGGISLGIVMFQY